ncbi:MAG: hypothetical protein HUK15_05115, partial [Bacteroidales bacterium]|nr:hypothetical protein [Bacteroidales bacterium]
MKKIVVVFTWFLCVAGFAFSQNLVKNHSFENAWTCPEDFVGEPVKYPFPDWVNPNSGTPDHIHACSSGRAGVPENFSGYMYPYDGSAYAGIILREKFDDSLKVYRGVSREYLQTELIKPLEKDLLYCVKFYYVNAKKSMFSVDALGVTLTVDKISAKNADRIIQRPQITNMPGHIMTEMDDWTEFCGYYRAKGGERFLTIGNFLDNNQTLYVTNHNEYSDSAFFYAYYLIDNVFVFEIGEVFECGCTNDLTWSTDWKSPSFDPKTGYNTRVVPDTYGDENLAENAGGGNADDNQIIQQADPNETDVTGLKTQITK